MVRAISWKSLRDMILVPFLVSGRYNGHRDNIGGFRLLHKPFAGYRPTPVVFRSRAQVALGLAIRGPASAASLPAIAWADPSRILTRPGPANAWAGFLLARRRGYR
jgi:hypothetical protein